MEETNKPEEGAGDKKNLPAQTGIDLNEILLPKKDAHAAENAARINAGALLQQEQKAELPKPERAPQVRQVPSSEKREDTSIAPIETFQSDIEKVVHNKNVSVVSIAAAEAERRGMESIERGPLLNSEEEGPSVIRRILFIIGGLILFGVAASLIYIVLRPAPSVNVEGAEQAPLINVDETKVLNVPPGALDHSLVITALNREREAVAIPLGLITRLYLAQATTSAGTQSIKQLSASRTLALLSPTVPQTLLRSVDSDEYILGVHSYEDNQAFLILKTNSYEQSFSAMLEWEYSMRSDLLPFFARTPRVRITTENISTSTATATPPVIATEFVDRIVENHDTRVIENSDKDILLLWTFLDRSTLVITTNDATLREVISRLKNAPIVPLP